MHEVFSLGGGGLEGMGVLGVGGRRFSNPSCN